MLKASKEVSHLMANPFMEGKLLRVERRLGRIMVERAGRKLVARMLVERVGTLVVEKILVAKVLVMVEAGVLTLVERVGTLVVRAGLPGVRVGSNAPVRTCWSILVYPSNLVLIQKAVIWFEFMLVIGLAVARK